MARIVDETKFWSWMTIEDFLDEVCSPNADAENQFDILVRRYQSEVNLHPYEIKKLSAPPTPRELLNEFLHYSFSGWSNLQDYKEGLAKMLTDAGVEQANCGLIVDQGTQLWMIEGRRVRPSTPLDTTGKQPGVLEPKAA